ncbi:MAG: hypothetical protein AB7O57_05515 [Hyphomicrobiaceae bacterium]
MSPLPSPDGRDVAPPTSVKLAVGGVLAVLLAGAGFLIWARGEAIVVDLATLAGKVWCF